MLDRKNCTKTSTANIMTNTTKVAGNKSMDQSSRKVLTMIRNIGMRRKAVVIKRKGRRALRRKTIMITMTTDIALRELVHIIIVDLCKESSICQCITIIRIRT